MECKLEKLKLYFSQAGFQGQELDKIIGAFMPRIFQAGDYFVEEGKVGRYLGFIEKGVFQYYILVNGDERTTYVTTENSFLASLLSFLNEVPAGEAIRAIGQGIVWQISKSQLQLLLNEVTGFKDFYIGLLEWQISCIEKSRLDFLTLTAEQRYEKMLKEEPYLLQQIPLHYLASIIGVTPRHLSRIRKNIS